ncbi:MAG: hypothetical protein WBW32_14885 [Luteibacter sp.]
MATLNGTKARSEIKRILTKLGVARSGLPAVTNLGAGKLYELYVLSRLLKELVNDGYTLGFSHPVIAFKTGGGPIKAHDFHIDLSKGGNVIGQLYTDVEVRTLGWQLGQVSDLSQYHEIDIVVVDAGTTGFPGPRELMLGIECKATATFQKSHVREALGRRRELSFFNRSTFPSRVFAGRTLSANPPSEYWLAFIDPAGSKYSQSPAVFSVDLRHWQP